MSKTPTDIFKQLRNYEEPVPAGVWERLRSALFGQTAKKQLQQLASFELAPPPHLLEQALDAAAEEALRTKAAALQAFEKEPPAHLYKGIIPKTKPVVQLLRKKQLWYAAAAVLLLVAAVVTVRISLQQHTDGTGLAAQQNAAQTDRAVTETASLADAAAKKQPYRFARAVAYPFHFKTVQVSGKRMTVYENDLLYSFTSLSAEEAELFFGKNEDPVIVSVDDYTNIRVSDFIIKQLQAVFKTKRNGKPTLAARWAKARISAWRKADRKAFDESKTKSPHDIIDLAETID